MRQVTCEVKQHVQIWFEQVVLGLNLCPFAHIPAKQGRVRFSVLNEDSEQALLKVLEKELIMLRTSEPQILETTVIIAPKGFEDFYYYMSVVDYVERWLSQNGWQGEVQVASFHPEYQFAGTQRGDIENLTNCAPYPLFHLIREASLTAVIDGGADTQSIPERNIKRITALTQEELKQLFPYFY